MWRIHQVRRLAVVFTVLYGGLLVEAAVAQAPTPACNPTIVGPNGTCTSSTTVTKPATPAGGPPVTTTQQTTTTNTTTYGTTTWQGLNWGIGIAADFDLGGKRVTGAEIDTVPGGTIVRVTDTSGNVGVSLVLEAHYFFKEWLPFANCQDYNCNDIAIGPFVAIEAGNATTSGSNGPITGYALGAMVGLHHPDPTSAKTNNSSWNFGIGLRVDPSATVLGDGVRANEAPPPGVTTSAQLLKKEPRYGVMLLSSFSF
jgi:hypothetical protein